LHKSAATPGRRLVGRHCYGMLLLLALLAAVQAAEAQGARASIDGIVRDDVGDREGAEVAVSNSTAVSRVLSDDMGGCVWTETFARGGCPGQAGGGPRSPIRGNRSGRMRKVLMSVAMLLYRCL
jgi:hypothetical protein